MLSAEFNRGPPQHMSVAACITPLTFDDALTVVSGAGPPEMGLEHRRFSLFDLQHQHVALVLIGHQQG